MKVIGAMMIFLSGAGGFLLWRERASEPIRVGEALLGDLAVLESCICRRQRYLPAILKGELAESAAGPSLWEPLLELLTGVEGIGLTACWQAACGSLPPHLSRILAPLGPLLPEGGRALSGAINEAREELTRVLHAQRQRQAEASRLGAAVSMAGACLLTLVLI